MNLIGLLIGTSIVLGTIPLTMEMQNRAVTQADARSTGSDLAEYALGMRTFIANAQANPALLPPAPVVGANWLKSPVCGGLPTNPPDGYIPCNFGNIGGFDTLFNANYTTTFTRNPATNFIEARATFIPVTSDPSRSGNVADAIVNTAREGSPTQVTGLFINYMSNVPTAANDMTGRLAVMSNPASPDFGRVLMIVSNSPSSDLWLRTDGTNQMLATLNVGGNDIANANNIQASGNVQAGGTLQAGNDLRVLNNASVANDASVGRDFSVGQDAIVGRDTVTARDAVVGRNVVVADGNVLVTNQNNGDATGIVVADDVIATDAALSNGAAPRMSQGIYEARVITGNPTDISKPSCPSSGSVPQIFTSFQSVASPDGFPIHGSNIRVTNNGGSWRVEPFVQTSGSSGFVPAPQSFVVITTKCS